MENIFAPFALTFKECAKTGRILYEGGYTALTGLYSSLPDMQKSFWAGGKGRKLHLGYVAAVIDRYADIAATDINAVVADKPSVLWERLERENDVRLCCEQAVRQALMCGDSVFKLSLDREISSLPIIEAVSGEKAKFNYKRGRLREIVFTSEVPHNGYIYILKEIYTKGAVYYRLFDPNGRQTDTDHLEETRGLQDILLDVPVLPAVPLKIFESTRYEGRGKALFADKADVADALDEVASQWLEAMRKGRVKKYIPETLIPRSGINGGLHTDGFDFKDDFVRIEGNMNESSTDTIQVIQPKIDYMAYSEALSGFLDMLLSGVMSPATLGIDLKRTDNALAQREKEKVTLYVRGKLTSALSRAVPQTIEKALALMGEFDTRISIHFGEYAGPDFSAVAETVGKAYQRGIMSAERVVEELYGEQMSEAEKRKEVERIKRE